MTYGSQSGGRYRPTLNRGGGPTGRKSRSETPGALLHDPWRAKASGPHPCFPHSSLNHHRNYIQAPYTAYP